MIKIERVKAAQPTMLRNGARQVVVQNMVVTAEELKSIEAESGTIVYSVDESQVNTLDFDKADATNIPESTEVATVVPESTEVARVDANTKLNTEAMPATTSKPAAKVAVKTAVKK